MIERGTDLQRLINMWLQRRLRALVQAVVTGS